MATDVPTKNEILTSSFVGELPDSNEQWSVAITDKGVVVLVNNDHPPHAVVDGKLVKVEANGMG